MVAVPSEGTVARDARAQRDGGDVGGGGGSGVPGRGSSETHERPGPQGPGPLPRVHEVRPRRSRARQTGGRARYARTARSTSADGGGWRSEWAGGGAWSWRRARWGGHL